MAARGWGAGDSGPPLPVSGPTGCVHRRRIVCSCGRYGTISFTKAFISVSGTEGGKKAAGALLSAMGPWAPRTRHSASLCLGFPISKMGIKRLLCWHVP